MERELTAELVQLESMISALPLAESARASLDAELRYARGVAGRVQVPRKWLAGMQHVYAMHEALIAPREHAAEARAMWPREQRPHGIAPWLRRS
jgi:hypothetical protein